MEYIHSYESKTVFENEYKISSRSYVEPWLSYVKEDGTIEYNVKPLLEIHLEDGSVLRSYDEDNSGIEDITTEMLLEPEYNEAAQMAGFKTKSLLFRWIEDNWNDDDNSAVIEVLEKLSVAVSDTLEGTLSILESMYFSGQVTYHSMDTLIIGGYVKQVSGTLSDPSLSDSFTPKTVILPESFTDISFLSGLTTLKMLVLKNPTPPSGSLNQNVTPIIAVPEGSRAAFIADSKWTALADYIVEVKM